MTAPIAGAPLRDLRTRLGLTTGELARLLGVEVWWVTAAEQGVVLPARTAPWLEVLSTWAVPSDPYASDEQGDGPLWVIDEFDSAEAFIAQEGWACEAMAARMREALVEGVVEAWAEILGDR